MRLINSSTPNIMTSGKQQKRNMVMGKILRTSKQLKIKLKELRWVNDLNLNVYAVRMAGRGARLTKGGAEGWAPTAVPR